MDGTFEVDESYFDARRRGGRRGRGAPGEVPAFDILGRGGRVPTRVIADAKRKALVPVIKRKVAPGVVYSGILGSHGTMIVFIYL